MHLGFGGRMRSVVKTGVMMAVALPLTGCGSNTVQEFAGISRDGPDEFQVVRRAPLTMPPNFNLRPPSEEVAERQRTAPTTSGTQALITGSNGQNETQLSGAEAALLARSDVNAQSDIRTVIADEDAQLSNLDRLDVFAVLDFQRELYAPKADVLDPVAETERLAAGKTNNVTIERVGSTPLNQIDALAEEAS